MGIQTVAVNTSAGQIKGATQEILDKTLRSSFAVFNDVASRGHKGGAMMADYYRQNNIGQPDPKAARRKGANFDL